MKQQVTVYGIPNCDMTKKTTQWLTKNKVAFSFHDYKKEGIEKDKLEEWCGIVGWEIIFNKKSTSWRELSKAEQDKVVNQPAAIKIMLKNNSIIKRPVLELSNNKLVVGFNEKQYQQEIM
jgi:arsenate reductase (glutaredoxin)